MATLTMAILTDYGYTHYGCTHYGYTYYGYTHYGGLQAERPELCRRSDAAHARSQWQLSVRRASFAAASVGGSPACSGCHRTHPPRAQVRYAWDRVMLTHIYTYAQVRYGWDDTAEINQLLAAESSGANYELRVRWRSSEELHVLCNHRGAAAAARLLTHALGASVDTSVLQPPPPPADDEAGGGEAAGRSGREAAGGDAASRRDEVTPKAQLGVSGGAAALRRTLGGLEGMVMHVQVGSACSPTQSLCSSHNPCARAHPSARAQPRPPSPPPSRARSQSPSPSHALCGSPSPSPQAGRPDGPDAVDAHPARAAGVRCPPLLRLTMPTMLNVPHHELLTILAMISTHAHAHAPVRSVPCVTLAH